MIPQYKNITVSKISDHGGTEKTPTHALVVSDSKYQNKKTVGKLWTKEGTNGKYLSGTMLDEWTRKDGTKEDAYVIVSKTELDNLIKEYLSLLPKDTDNRYYPTEAEVANPDDIPF